MTGARVSLKKRSESTRKGNADSFFLDADIFLYASGRPSPHKNTCLEMLEGAASGDYSMRTSTEVVQEVLHRYSHIGRRDFGIELARRILNAFGPVIAVQHRDVNMAAEIMVRYPRVRSRDAIHVAVALNNGIRQIISTDRDFDIIKEIDRIHPADFISGR